MSRKAATVAPAIARTLALIALLGTTACGQKGPLYLPDEAPASSQSSDDNDDDRARQDDSKGG